MSKIDIAMVVWNRPEITEKVIKALAKNTTTPSRLLVVDNGSDHETNTMLKDFLDKGLIDFLLHNEENLGLEPAKNQLMNHVESDLFISTDNDCIPEKPVEGWDWLSRLVLLMEKNPEYAAIASRPQVFVGTNMPFGDEEVLEFPHPGGSLRIMRTNLVNNLGRWRDHIPSRGNEEKYICGKLRSAGHKTGYARDVRCFHLFGKDGNWGYGTISPEDHGHNPVWHPAIQQGDSDEELAKYI